MLSVLCELCMNTDYLERSFVRVQYKRKKPSQNVSTFDTVIVPVKQQNSKYKVPDKTPRVPKTEQTETENKNTSYLSIYL